MPIPGLVFGVAHAPRFLNGDLPLIDTLTMMGYSVFFGIVFDACLLRNRSICR